MSPKQGRKRGTKMSLSREETEGDKNVP